MKINKNIKVPLFETKVSNKNELSTLSYSFVNLLKSGKYVLGTNLEIFENELKKYLNVKYVVGVNSGTDAIMLSLISLGIKKGDLVITTAFTYFATIEAIKNVGAVPYVVDIKMEDLQIDFDKIDERILNKAKFIIPVHLFGYHVDIEKLLKLKTKFNLTVVEDVAQAFGTKVGKNYLGTFGDTGAFSFYPTKTLGAIGDAGAIVTNSRSVYEDLTKLRNHGHITRDKFKFAGYNSRLDEIQAIYLLTKLKNIEKIISSRKKIAASYIKNFNEISDITCFENENHTFNYFPILVKNSKQRAKLVTFLEKNGIQTAIYYKKPLSDLKFDWIKSSNNLINVNLVKNRILCLPIYENLNEKKQNHVIKSIQQFYDA